MYSVRGMNKAAGKKKTTTTEEKPQTNEFDGVKQFAVGMIDIGWRLAITVIFFLWSGTRLDEWLGTEPWFALAGFILIIISFVLIVRRSLNQLPKQFGGNK